MSDFEMWQCMGCGETGAGQFPPEHADTCRKKVSIEKGIERYLERLQDKRRIAALEQELADARGEREEARQTAQANANRTADVMIERDAEREMRTRSEEVANANADKANAVEAVCASISASVGFTGPTERLADAVESAMDLSRKTLTEYQRAERERIAALADNAALVEEVVSLSTMLSGPTVTASTRQRLRSHPGTALLEEHRKEIEELSRRVLEVDQERLRWKGMHGTAIEEHRTALVRARNEGLEKAAVRLAADASRHRWTDADEIRALKEPEQ